MFKNHILLVPFFISFILSSQTVSTVTESSFSDGLALDLQGNLYCSDWGGNTVYKYDTNGNVSIFKNGFRNPNGIAVNSANEIYICDHTDNKILKYDSDGNLMEEYNIGFITPAGIKKIPNTEDMLVVEYGNKYSAATTITNSTIKKLGSDGRVTTLHSGLPLNGPAGITFINNVPYIANYNDRKIFRFENGTLTEITQLPSEGSLYRNAIGFLSSIDNQLIASHIGGNKIYKINPVSGIASVYVGSSLGSKDGNIGTATLDSPNGILGDEANDRIYISQGSLNPNNRNLRIINGAVLSANSLDLAKINFNVFPNPTKDSLNIELIGIETYKIELSIFDINGKQIFKKSINKENSVFEYKIKITDWDKGVYFLKVKSDKDTLMKKIIVK